MNEELEKMIGKQVVVDTDSHLVYLGVLTKVGKDYISVREVDVHSVNDTQTSREIYVMESKRYGIRENRKDTVILMRRIVSVSCLDDVKEE